MRNTKSYIPFYHSTLTVKDELQDQVLYTNDSFGNIYNIMKTLDGLHPEDIYSASIKVVEQIMKTKEVAFYIRDITTGEMKLEAQSNGLIIPEGLLASESIKEIMRTKQVYVNKALDQHGPSMVVPVLMKDSLVGMITVNNPQFEYLTLYYQNLLFATANLISQALERSYKYQDGISRTGYSRANTEEAYV
jgi:UDP-glucuronate decarboxylase